MNIPKRKTERSLKSLGVINGNTRCWFDKKSKAICFRQFGRKRKVESVSLTKIFDTVTGQSLMPFA